MKPILPITRFFPIALSCALLFSACGGSSGGDPNTPDGETSEAEDDGPPEDETAYERKLRLAKEKREQCAEFVDAVQAAEKSTSDIININDQLKLNFLAKGVDRRIKGLEALEFSVAELIDLRQRYLAMAKDSSAALREAAGNSKETAKKAALKHYFELDGQGDALVEEINAFCGGGAATDASEEEADAK